MTNIPINNVLTYANNSLKWNKNLLDNYLTLKVVYFNASLTPECFAHSNKNYWK